MQYGVDIAIRRADDLDKMMLGDIAARAARGETPTVLDIGCGAGGQARRMATYGAAVTAIDIIDYADEFVVINQDQEAIGEQNPISFVQSDILSWLQNNSLHFDIVCFQRTLHYVSYKKAVQVLSNLRTITKGALYLSVTGAGSAIAKAYPALGDSMTKRFEKLSPDAQSTFCITAPLCIYHEDEVHTLLKDTGWSVVQSRVSDFGNIKVVATSNVEGKINMV
ncbi:MAG: class I SAM-dependent methyltransferase [Candidatus Paceibacteria bacterium]